MAPLVENFLANLKRTIIAAAILGLLISIVYQPTKATEFRYEINIRLDGPIEPTPIPGISG